MMSQRFVNNVMCSLGALLVFFSYSVQAKDAEGKPSVTKKSKAQEDIYKIASEKGSPECVSQMTKLTDWAGAASPDVAGTMVSYSGLTERSDLLSAAVSTRGPESGLQMGFINVSQGKSCSANGMLIRMWRDKCGMVVDKVFTNYKATNNFAPSVQIYMASEDELLYAIDLASEDKDAVKNNLGCITIVQSMVFDKQ